MAVNIANLATVLSVNSAGLTSGLGAAGNKFSGFVGSVAGFGTRLLGIGAAIGGLVGTIRSVMSVADQFGDIDSIAKFSQETGIATEELVGLQHAAELSGVSATELQNAQRRALREGFSGGIAEIADQMAALETPVERAQLAYRALGRSGQALIPLLQQGGDAIRAMVQEGADLAGFSPADAAKVEEANDAITRMKLAFTGIARDIAITLAPAVEFIGTALTSVGRMGRDIFGDIREEVTFLADVGTFAFQNLETIVSLAFLKGHAAFLGFKNDAVFFFTDQVPALLSWFGQNWETVFLDILNFASTTFANLGLNISNTMQGIWDFIASGGEKSLELAWRPLTQGFQSAIESLPPILERTLTFEEQILQGVIDSTEERLQGGLAAFVTERQQARMADAATMDVPEIDLSEDATKGIGELKGVGVAQRGSSEAFSSIFAAMRGDQKDPPTAKAQQDQLAETKNQTKVLQRLEKLQPIELVAGEV